MTADPLPVRLYRWLLVILPLRFRRERGPAMVAMFRDEWREVRGSKRLLLAARTARDLVWTAIVERVSRSSGSGAHTNAASAAAGERAEEHRRLWHVSWLDVKLGVRMVAKYPGLSLVSVLGMAVAIAIGAGVFSVISAIVDPTLPLPGGDRVVAVMSRRADIAADAEMRVLHDFVVWRSELRTSAI